jgi:hypothetical protein
MVTNHGRETGRRLVRRIKVKRRTGEAPTGDKTGPFSRMRRYCLALPGAREGLSRRTPVFCVGGRQFAMFVDDHHGKENEGIWAKADDGLQAALAESDSNRFFIPPYLGVRGWIGIRLYGRPNWTTIERTLFKAFLMTAPKRLAQAAPAPGSRVPGERPAGSRRRSSG